MQHVRVVRAARVITPDRQLADGWVSFGGDRILGVGEGDAPSGALAAGEAYDVLVPGFVDIHNHGGGGAGFADGADAARTARAAHLREGTTTLVASLVTDTIDRLLWQVRSLVPLVEAEELAGIHLEGPWLAPQWCGAHPPELLTDADPSDVRALVAAAAGGLVMVTLAPERKGAMGAIELLCSQGVRVAIGHTDATYDQTRAAIAAGATVATHLYNASRPPHHREPGPAPALLEDPSVLVESVVDGVHLHPAVVRATAQAAAQRWVLVTDAMAAALLGDGSSRLGRLAVDVVDGVARLREGGSLAGSTLCLARAVRTAVELGVPLPAAVRAATLAPASALGRDDVGRLEPGCRADLVALGADLQVRAVIRRGRWVER